MKCVLSTEQLETLWQAARKGTDEDGNDYAEGAYDMIQAITGNGDIETVLNNLKED